MQFKKLLSGALSVCMTASAVLSNAAFSASAAAATEFNITSDGKNTVTISAADLKDGDVTVPVEISISKYDGLSALQLKFQIDDGDEDADGILQNKGFKFSDAELPNPYVFGDPSEAFSAYFTASQMNLSWFNTQNADTNAEAVNADAPLAKASLVVPQLTPAGEYKLDVRREKFVNSLSASGNKQYGQSECLKAESEEAVEYDTVPLTIKIEAAEETTTSTTTTTTTESTTTTTTTTVSTTTTTTTATTTDTTVTSTTTTTTSEVTTDTSTTTTTSTPSGDIWVDDYTIENGGHYIILQNVAAKPGETVDVEALVFGDAGTAGLQLYFEYDSAIKLQHIYDGAPGARSKKAYTIGATVPTDDYPTVYPVSYVFAGQTTLTGKEGGTVATLRFEIPEDAKAGTVYEIAFSHKEGSNSLGTDREAKVDLPIKFYDGSITVVADDSPAISRESYGFSAVGDTVNLNVFNAVAPVAWTSSDENVATVDKNGFVTCTGEGTATITAKDGDGKEYTCTVSLNDSVLFGDANLNGQIDIDDAILVMTAFNYEMMGDESPIDPRAIADVNMNGSIDIDDAISIITYYNWMIADLDPTWYEITGNENAPDAPQA